MTSAKRYVIAIIGAIIPLATTTGVAMAAPNPAPNYCSDGTSFASNWRSQINTTMTNNAVSGWDWTQSANHGVLFKNPTTGRIAFFTTDDKARVYYDANYDISAVLAPSQTGYKYVHITWTGISTFNSSTAASFTSNVSGTFTSAYRLDNSGTTFGISCLYGLKNVGEANLNDADKIAQHVPSGAHTGSPSTTDWVGAYYDPDNLPALCPTGYYGNQPNCQIIPVSSGGGGGVTDFTPLKEYMHSLSIKGASLALAAVLAFYLINPFRWKL